MFIKNDFWRKKICQTPNHVASIFFYSENSPDDMAKECADLILAEGEVGKKWLK
jgi:hypothetical protein